ncbi:MAG TPA: PilZ domain-containing protein [Polaromonas sp.]|uniref:PilZ domain-containing protein n=1 Tax=Polaromonas sp. TaxID=1869339 RepID=UPI002D7036CF|nr:PilZ domain-containing protein [Polaromonas sp.]HYW58770.1 PilZ domain-containing protein [Polaromonas sp.]
MKVSGLGEKKAVVVNQRAAQRFGVALRLTIAGGEGITHDLSASGLYFESDRSYEVGSVMELVLEFPGSTRVHPLPCEAEVVRVSNAGESFNVAVRLMEPLFPEQI